ncbi:MAG TPA: glycosyltransferase family 4 protein [Frankiaceae bacterium]|nr:glycosyltransferase family 4 protein [Frankiaceae bacterium]
MAAGAGARDVDRPRVLFVTNLLTHYRKPLFHELSRRLPVRFVFFSDGGEWYWHGTNSDPAGLNAVFPRGRWVGRTRVTPGLVAEMARQPYDVVVTSLVGKFALAVSYLGARARRRTVVLWATMWSHPETAFHRRTERITNALYRDADAIVTYGRHVSRHVVSKGADPARVFVAPQAVDLTLFRRDRPPYDGPVRITFVGRLEPEKGVEDLLAAFRLLDERGVAYVPVIYGAGSVDVPGGRGKVPNDQLPAVYNTADVVVIPSRLVPEFAEPWSLAVNEAMGCGATVVASDAVGAVQDGLVTDGETGLVFPNGDVVALADALERLATDAALRRRLAEAGHAAIQAFTYVAAADAFVRAAQAAISRDRRALRRKRALPTK